MRTLSSLQCYLATRDDTGVQVHQYAPGGIRAEVAGGPLELTVRTEYPWRGRVDLEITQTPTAEWTLALRIPAWCGSAAVVVRSGELPPSPASPPTGGGAGSTSPSRCRPVSRPPIAGSTLCVGASRSSEVRSCTASRKSIRPLG